MQFDKKTMMSLFIALIMIVSVIGFAISFVEPKQEADYGNYEFVLTSQGWQTRINNIKLYFINHPTEVEYIKMDDATKNLLQNNRVLWFTYDPNDTEAQAIADALYYAEQAVGTVKNTFVQRGLINNTGYALPEVTCLNATQAVPVLILQSGNETKTSQQANCITATAENQQAVYEIGDRILYTAIGVMN
jgi:hypothetical protein